MKVMKNNLVLWGIGIVAVLALGLSLNISDGRDGRNGQDGLGGIASPEVQSYMRVHGYFMQGGQILATSTTDTTETIKATDMLEFDILDFTPLTGATTYTLPATTTFPTIANPGNYRSWVFRNATSTATNITIAGGTGIDLQEPDGQNVIIGQNNYAWITCYRKADTDITCLVDESIPAD